MHPPPLSGPRERVFLLLAGLFIAALIVCNLIANRFVAVDLGFKVFVVSAGILPYPVTFLVTDVLSEIYGKRRANQVVWIGFVVSLFVLGVLWLGMQFPAVPGSRIDDAEYFEMFGNSWRIVFASMTAYLVAQLVDIRLFHFWRRLTDGRHLWLRNNASTIVSQLVDTVLVVCVLFAGDPQWPTERIVGAIVDGWLFKTLVALADTPWFYAAVFACRRWLPDALPARP